MATNKAQSVYFARGLSRLLSLVLPLEISSFSILYLMHINKIKRYKASTRLMFPGEQQITVQATNRGACFTSAGMSSAIRTYFPTANAPTMTFCICNYHYEHIEYSQRM